MNSTAAGKEPVAMQRSSCTQTTFTIDPVPSRPRAYRLEISGFLAPGWTARLTAGLAQHRIAIERCEAEKTTVSNWLATFELKAAPFAKDALTVDYLALASTELPADRKVSRIELIDFLMEPAKMHDGSLYIQLKGVDRLGFLGDLLDYFSMRCLFPVKMSIETAAEKAIDRFWLKGVGGSVPSSSITDSIRENLTQLLVCTK